MIKSSVNSLANFYNYYVGNQTLSSLERQEDQTQESVENADLKTDLGLRVCIISQFDPRVEIDTKMWAVTLIVDKSIFHARLIIEGLTEDFGPFFQITDLQRPSIDTNLKAVPHCCFFSIKFGKVYLSKPKKTPIKLIDLTGKTNTWSRSRTKVELMVAKIQEEVSEINEDEKGEKIQKNRHPIPFSIFGRRSIFAKEAEFFETENPELLKILKENPDKFVKLYHLYENHKFPSRHKLPEILHAEEYIANHVDLPLYRIGGIPLLLTGWVGTTFLLPVTIPLTVYSAFIENFLERREKRKVRQNEDMLNLMDQHVKKITKIPDNCYTWACEKLKIIDVQAPEYATDRWIAISTLFASQAIDSFDLKLKYILEEDCKELYCSSSS